MTTLPTTGMNHGDVYDVPDIDVLKCGVPEPLLAQPVVQSVTVTE